MTPDSAFALLADVAQDDTQWSIVYDLRALEVHYRTRLHPTVRTIRLMGVAGDCGGVVRGLPIHERAGAEPSWEAWTGERNRALIEDVLGALEDREGLVVPASAREALIGYPSERCPGAHRPTGPAARDIRPGRTRPAD